MAKKEKWITYPGEYPAEIKKFSTDPLKFGIEILKFFYEDSEEWEKIYKEDNSIRIEDCIEEITNGEIEYDSHEIGFFKDYNGAYIKTC